MTDLPQRMTPSQFITSRIGGDAETICALLSDIQTLMEENAEQAKTIEEQAARIKELEAPAPPKGDDAKP